MANRRAGLSDWQELLQDVPGLTAFHGKRGTYFLDLLMAMQSGTSKPYWLTLVEDYQFPPKGI